MTIDLDAEIRLYRTKAAKSRNLFKKACQYLPGGISHQIRAYPPFPFLVAQSRGPYLYDVDGNEYLDYWMGHYSMLFGHSPENIKKALREQLDRGIMWGSIHEQEVLLAEKLCHRIPSIEKIRFCTTGTEATMFAIRLARGYTGKNLVLKMVGGWHGPSSDLLHGVTQHFDRSESLGLPSMTSDFLQSLPFNDIEVSAEILNQPDVADNLAAIIVEPMLGSSWFIPARSEYLAFLREICTRLNAVLIFDEIITGFRVSGGGAQQYYGITPDLTTLGKVLGAGMPISAVGGKTEIMERCNPYSESPKWERVRIGGGTFSCHPLSISSSLAMIQQLDNDQNLYSRLDKTGTLFRQNVVRIFNEYSIPVAATGIGSLFTIHFLDSIEKPPDNPLEAIEKCYYSFKEKLFKLLLCNRGIYVMHAGGAFSLVHESEHIDRTYAVLDDIASHLHPNLMQKSNIEFIV